MRGASSRKLAAVARFHAGVGARLALRAAAPGAAAVFGAGTLLGPDFLDSLAGVVYGRGLGLAAWAMVALVAWGVAAGAAARVVRGLGGWVRHLPVDRVTQRRGAAMAVALAEVPLLLGLSMLAVGAAGRAGHPHSIGAAVVGLMVLAVAAGVGTVPCRRGWLARPLAMGAAVLAASGRWPLVAGAMALLALADGAAGALAVRPRGPGRRWTSGRWIEGRIAWRALGSRLASSYAVAVVPLGCGALFLANNELPGQDAALAARLAIGCSVVFLFAGLGEELAVRRPAWPWARSLPWSSRRRVAGDGLLLALHAAPLVGLGMARAPLPALAVAAMVPWLALRTAGAVRRAPERRTGAAGEVLLEGMAAAAAVALVPSAAMPLLLAAPWAARAAAERERRQKVSRWLALHHLAAGDPQSWSAE